MATTPTASHAPTLCREIQTAPRIHQGQTQQNTTFVEIQEEVQEGHNQGPHETPVLGEQPPPSTSGAVPSTGSL